MHFVSGMTCCKPGRVAIGLECDVADMMICATHSCQTATISQLPGLLRRLITIFPADRLAQIAQAASCLDEALPILATQCAALPTKTVRQGYVNELARVLSEADQSKFVSLHAAEWARRRGISNTGAAK